MKTIGLIGGMSWESTVTYYQIINEVVKSELGGLHSAKCLLYSVDFAEIEKCQAENDWEKSAQILSEAASSLERGGADFIVICTNTMHKVASQIGNAVSVPILHIAEMTALELKKQGITKVGLLGTRYTMEQDFYKQVLVEYDIEVLIPEGEDLQTVHDVIYNELCLGILKETSRKAYIRIIDGLKDRGAKGVILGCTEIGLLINQGHTTVPLFDTTLIHANYAARKAIV